jgi:UDP:flavonoid glycosyltransferase YjiC (YdhE family)
VTVTLGNAAPQVRGVGPVERVIDAARHVDAEFVIALGDAAAALSADTMPSNVHLVGWTPLSRLLDRSDLMIHHGGSGTTLTSLAKGVPQLVAPQLGDNHLNAEAVQQRGCGVEVRQEDIDADLIHDALAGDKLRQVAAEVMAEIAEMPTPSEVAARLVEFAAS